MVVGRHYNTSGHKGICDITIFVLDFINTHPDSISPKYVGKLANKNASFASEALSRSDLT